MSDPKSAWSRREHVQHDGVKYDVVITKSGAEYHAEWKCGACGEIGASSLTSSTAEQASKRAQISLYAHHTVVHRQAD